MPKMPRKTRKVTLEELIALNDEIIALVRAGVPLEMGLRELGEDRAGVLGRLAVKLAGRLSQGESLPEALSHEELGLPRTYRAIVEAGLRAGRLTVALEGVSKTAWKLADLRRRIGLAMVYPLIVLMLAYGLFLLLCTQLLPRMKFLLGSLGFQMEIYERLVDIGREAYWWGWILPAVVVLLVLWWRSSGNQGFLSQNGRPAGMARLCPGLKKAVRYYHASQFADLLALLIEQEVPLTEAIVLAAEATGDQRMISTAGSIADETSRGLPAAGHESRGFPPYLQWLITRPEAQGGMVQALRTAADMYRRKAVLIIEWIKVTFPVVAAVLIGGGATLIYTLTVFWPLTELLKSLAEPVI